MLDTIGWIHLICNLGRRELVEILVGDGDNLAAYGDRLLDKGK